MHGRLRADPAPWSLDGIPADFNGKLLAPDWPRFAEIMDGAVRRVPAIGDAGINRMINGPEGFTPDNEFILGESEVRGFCVAAGFSAHGIAGAGGIGRQVASWIVDGQPELDLWKMDIRRFGAAYRTQPTRWLARSRTTRPTTTSTTRTRNAGPAGRCEPHRPTTSWRGSAPRLARSPAGNARTGSSRMRRRATRPPAEGLGGDALVAGDRRGGAGHPAGGRAVRRDLVREARGRRAGRDGVPWSMCANEIDRPVGSIVYTQLLDRRGGIQADLTVTRLAARLYLLVTGTAVGNHDAAWLREHLPDDGQSRCVT